MWTNGIFWYFLRGQSLRKPFIYTYLPQQFLYFFPEPQGHGSFLPTLTTFLGSAFFIFVLSVTASPLATCFLSTFCLISAFNKYVVISLSTTHAFALEGLQATAHVGGLLQNADVESFLGQDIPAFQAP